MNLWKRFYRWLIDSRMPLPRGEVYCDRSFSPNYQRTNPQLWKRNHYGY
jgi:hypothetical protein